MYLKKLLLDFFDVKCETVEYLNTELIRSNKNDKIGIVDLLLNIDNNIVILELQNIDRHNFKERLLFYSSSIIANHCLKVSEDYRNLRMIKLYAIINYNLLDNSVKNRVRLKSKNKIFTKKLEYQIFNLARVDINNKNNSYYEMANLFKTNNLNKLTRIIENNLNMEILNKIKYYNLDSKEYKKMDDIAKMMMEETEHYESAYEDGIEIGIERGLSEGISQGISQYKRQIAKNMLIENVDISLISKYTNMSIEEIESLR